jgi:hypothetical protein
MSAVDAIPELDPDVLYELCPDCEDRGKGCMTCWDEGLVVHECADA